MNLEQLKKRLEEIRNEMAKFGDSLTEAEVNALSALSDEASQVMANITTLEKAEAVKAKMNQGTGRTSEPQAVAPAGHVRVVENAHELRTHGFKSQGEFYKAVMNASRGIADDRLTKYSRNVNNTAISSSGEDGAFLVPEDFRTNILKKVEGDESLLTRTTGINTERNSVRLPINETAPWSGSGFAAYWKNEAAAYTASKDVFGSTLFELQKLTCLVNITDELLDDAPALESWINANAPSAMLHKVNDAIIGGVGGDRPLGFLNSSFAYTVAKEGGQSADTVLYKNVAKMYNRMLPSSVKNAVWLINPAVQDQLMFMEFAPGSSTPVPVYLPANGASGQPFATLFGRPVLPFMGGTKALGDKGDIAFVDLAYYISVMKTAGIKQQSSIHAYFAQDIQSIKFTMRVGGQCPFKSTVMTQNGSYEMSGLVLLEDR